MPKSQKSSSLSQLRVGIFVLLGLAILAFMILNSSGDFNPFEKKIRLKARFASADGLRNGAEVQLAGVHIGKVENVVFLPPDSPGDSKIEAVMLVGKSLDGRPVSERIRSDSTAQLIATSVLANDKMINITPGTARGIPVEENHVLESSAAISINQLTSTGNDLLQQINKLAIPTNEILNKANQGEGTLGRIINDQSLYQNLDASVGEAKLTMLKIQNLIDRLKAGDGSAGKLINDPALYDSLNSTVSQLEAISKDLKAGRGTAGKFLTDDALYNEAKQIMTEAREGIKKINKIAEDFQAISGDLSAGKGTAGKLLKDEAMYEDVRNAINRINSTTAKMETLLADAQAGKGTVGKLLTDESLFNNLNQTSGNINQFSSEATKMIYDFRQNPKKYLTIQLKLF